MKTISKDKPLLFCKCVDSGQTEFNERHRVKEESERDILQSSMSSDPNTTTNYGEQKVITCFASHVKKPIWNMPLNRLLPRTKLHLRIRRSHPANNSKLLNLMMALKSHNEVPIIIKRNLKQLNSERL